ncbi:uncharacterized protein VP01_1252g1 [Puccinia sorghi]|uniref:Reverse transcriptase Ty1/copia-type domain-containing protein n=1 Tax=Puccinia sorghi TaxID=27349 RepID=A0A0L6VPC5_9BASI|nr:uncharacterized protein VP01_1252g1 [Puccinia sorghi]
MLLSSYLNRNEWMLESFDVMAAYLHGEINEDIWAKVPDGMLVPEEHKGKSLKLDKGLYGTKQGGRCWWKHFVTIMNDIGFSVSFYDDSFYHIQRGGDTILVWIHVNDGVVTASSKRVMGDFQSVLESKLSVTWDGTLHTIVGIKVERPSLDNIVLSQPFLTDKIIEKFTSDVTLPCAIPIKDTNTLTSTTTKEDIINPNGYFRVSLLFCKITNQAPLGRFSTCTWVNRGLGLQVAFP